MKKVGRLSSKVFMIKKRKYSKIYKSASSALQDIKKGNTLLVGGFGLCGIPLESIEYLSE